MESINVKGSLLILILFGSLTLNVCGQSIPSFWMNIYKLENFHESRNGEIKRIVADKKGYYSNGQSYKEKWVYNFIDPYNIQGEYYKDKELKARFIYEFDSLNRRTKNVIESKVPLIGWQKETYTFEYVGNNRDTERHFDANNNLLRFAKYEYDALGRPTQLQLYNSNGELDSYETADYQDNYKYIHKIFNSTGDLVFQEIKFSNIDTSLNLSNSNGDLTKHVWPTSSQDNKAFYIHTYKYDSSKNWTERHVQVESKNKQRKQSAVTRKITYFRK
ncbi:hypothetical protein [uncultured Pontibacter sp.]|uniref:hypothetical protein n=1 Tax=uncultured Pontibacter sp. TaxID=453356 RepID=UPI00262AEE3D|nr:hypothetical protein [uncultured Pontibacter sp.]